jgi:ubiquinone biosynthesis protein
MPGPPSLERLLAVAPPGHLGSLAAVFGGQTSTAERVESVGGALRASGRAWHDEIGCWIADLLRIEELVPERYSGWRPLIRECMAFFMANFPDERLATKIVEQLELPPDCPTEVRLGLLISKTPGLQKLGQVLARNRRLGPGLRGELQKLEDGIHDVDPARVFEIVQGTLGKCMEAYQVGFAPVVRSEASVSAIVEFTWFNPSTGCREEGVFKVMKPYIPTCFAEDLTLLKRLSEHLLAGRPDGQASIREAAGTLDEVRLLLEREIDFRREQATLAEVARVYRRTGVRAPSPIPQLSTDTITAMSLERGVKVTEAIRKRTRWGRRVATRIVEALVADPILSSEDHAIFHADPHAGNLLYDEASDQLIVLDWALTGRLTRDERRHLIRLIVMMTLRDATGVRAAIEALALPDVDSRAAALAVIDRCVTGFFRELPLVCSLGAIDAMRLLDRVGMEGVRFPGALVLIRKTLFTLEGVLRDVAGVDVRLDMIVARSFAANWLTRRGALPGPLTLDDLLAIERSAFFYGSGLWSLAN